MGKKLRCFVAMSFGNSDTDDAYSKLIKPAIENAIGANKIEPVRIDQINHNENIDRKIMKELNECDLLLADLTYARPSVYFEAGYAENRDVPVIYTCRKDHFSPKPNDEYGNFKIHFDLLMRNIIGWTQSSNVGFKRKLAARIRFVTAPLVKQKEKEERERKEIRNFANFPVSTRLEKISDRSRKYFKRLGFKGFDLISRDEIFEIFDHQTLLDRRNHHLFHKYFGPGNTWWGIGKDLKKFHVIHVLVSDKFLIQEIRRLAFLVKWPPFNLNLRNNLMTLEHLYENYVICLLGRISLSQVTSVFRDYSVDSDSKVLALSCKQRIPKMRFSKNSKVYQIFPNEFSVSKMKGRKGFVNLRMKDNNLIDEYNKRVASLRTINRAVRIHLIDQIQSERDLMDRVSTLEFAHALGKP